MNGNVVIILGVLVGVLQMILLALAGIFLAKAGPLDKEGERKFALGNYFLFLPLFCFIEIVEAVKWEEIDVLAYIIMSFLVSSLLSTILAMVYSELFGVDLRCRRSFVLLCTFANTSSYPVVLARSLCEAGNPLDGDPSCPYGAGYALISLLLFNALAWTIGPPMIDSDRTKCYNFRRKAYVIKQFYPHDLEDFLEDENLDEDESFGTSALSGKSGKSVPAVTSFVRRNYAELQEEIINDEDNRRRFYAGDAEVKDDEVSGVLEERNLIEYALIFHLTRKNEPTLNDRFHRLLSSVNPRVFNKIMEKIPSPIRSERSTCAGVVKKLFSPPVIGCVLGLVFGLVSVVREWFLSDSVKPYFMNTLILVGDMAVPVIVMILGAKLAGGFQFSDDVNLRYRDLFACIAIRLLILPACGLGYMYFMHSFFADDMRTNGVLSFILYAFWDMPPSLVLVSVFLIYKYFCKECALIQFWLNVIAVLTLPIFLVAYFTLFPPMLPSAPDSCPTCFTN